MRLAPIDQAGIVDAIPDIVFRYRLLPEPGFDYVSPSVTEITGYTPEDHYADPLLGMRIVHPDDLPIVEEATTNADERRTYHIRWRARDGHEFVTEQRLRRVVDGSGSLVAIIGVCRPVEFRRSDWLLEAGELRIDFAESRAFLRDRPIELTPAEHRILSRLAVSDRVVTRRELVEALWGVYQPSGERAVEVHVSKLRRKLEPDPLRPRHLLTERGVGYRLSRDGTQPSVDHRGVFAR